MKTWEIYKHTNRITGKSYIGQTCCGSVSRWQKHCYSAFNKPEGYFHKAIAKYGKDVWDMEILESGINNIDECNDKEKEYIAKYNTIESGYNLKLGGAAEVLTEEVKKLLTDKIRKYHNTKVVSLYNIKTKATIQGYPGDICKELGFSPSPFSDIIRGRRRSVKNWVIDTPENRKYKPIVRHWFIHDTLGTDYASLDEMVRKYSSITSRGNLSAVIYGNRSTHQGWRLIKQTEGVPR